jgi:hypothetical protein
MQLEIWPNAWWLARLANQARIDSVLLFCDEFVGYPWGLRSVQCVATGGKGIMMA